MTFVVYEPPCGLFRSGRKQQQQRRRQRGLSKFIVNEESVIQQANSLSLLSKNYFGNLIKFFPSNDGCDDRT